ncbi:MAG: nitroreductase [Chiayiivirga sp.]|uniref:nitroreductase family protein n=1 Tax=Chiayiivirga sp. TaxID=2041042 RepID=UPI0025BCDAE0|nr:nitroreductase [Chiayiivirga sp.]MCI1710449.1 nitroreductase [Chiayiivirga sp.]MCI1728745.1 nitroreductase [Chiayiivirga sp.]
MTSPMTLLAPLFSRHSTPSRLLAEPGPDRDQLAALLAAAVHVPDHGKLTPWRFIRIHGPARARLGEQLAIRQRERDPGAPQAVIDKDRERFNFAPLVITVVACLTPGHKVPEQEQLLSAGCVCFSLLQAAQALGFGAQWLTGWAAYDPQITQSLGLGEDERIIGFIHIGTAREAAPERPRPDPIQRMVDWVG